MIAADAATKTGANPVHSIPKIGEDAGGQAPSPACSSAGAYRIADPASLSSSNQLLSVDSQLQSFFPVVVRCARTEER